MIDFLNNIRKPMQTSLTTKIVSSFLIFIAGIIFGVVSKVLDETASNYLPYFLQVMDLRNFFSRIGVWIFLGVLISTFSKSPIKAAINVFLFFAGMVGSYYLYTVKFAGFFPKSYMMIWIVMTAVSSLLAFVCWYAKGRGIIALCISSVILLIVARQAFGFGVWYFYIKYYLEMFLFIATIIVLYRSPKQIIKVLVTGVILFLLTSQISFWWI